MLRLRLAFLALASGLLVSLSGCMSSNPCSESRSFSRLFQGNLMSRPSSRIAPAECDCHNAYLPPMHEGDMMSGPPIMTMPAPIMTMPMPTPVPITNLPATTMPTTQPPSYFKMPHATTTPYNP